MSKIEKYHVKRDKMRMMLPLVDEADRKHIAKICGISPRKVTNIMQGHEWDDYRVMEAASEIAVMRIEDFRKEFLRMKRWLRS